MQSRNTYNYTSACPAKLRLRGGFTLTELLVVLAIFTTLFTYGLLMSMRAFTHTTLRSERDTLVELLLRARELAMNNIYASPWGVCFDDVHTTYTLFQGITFTPSKTTQLTPARSASDIPGLPLCSSGGIVFSRHTGSLVPQLTPKNTSISVHLVERGQDEVITINNEGRITW